MKKKIYLFLPVKYILELIGFSNPVYIMFQYPMGVYVYIGDGFSTPCSYRKFYPVMAV